MARQFRPSLQDRARRWLRRVERMRCRPSSVCRPRRDARSAHAEDFRQHIVREIEPAAAQTIGRLQQPAREPFDDRGATAVRDGVGKLTQRHADLAKQDRGAALASLSASRCKLSAGIRQALPAACTIVWPDETPSTEQNARCRHAVAADAVDLDAGRRRRAGKDRDQPLDREVDVVGPAGRRRSGPHRDAARPARATLRVRSWPQAEAESRTAFANVGSSGGGSASGAQPTNVCSADFKTAGSNGLVSWGVLLNSSGTIVFGL